MAPVHVLGSGSAFAQADLDECLRVGSCTPIQVTHVVEPPPALTTPPAVRPVGNEW